MIQEEYAPNDGEFRAFPKIHRWQREIVVTEKIDGTNGIVYISNDLHTVKAGSRNRWLSEEADNYGFHSFVMANRSEILRLGPGYHYGEWYGKGIQRGYGLNDRRFALFNTSRWMDDSVRPRCCEVVPVLYQGTDLRSVDAILSALREHGSVAVEKYMNPEGVVIYHTHSNHLYKKTLDNNDAHKEVAISG